MFTKDEAIRHLYTQREKTERDARAYIQTALAEGEAKGRAKGRAEGIAKIAINMFKEEISIDIIAKTTQLTKEEIQKLAAKIL